MAQPVWKRSANQVDLAGRQSQRRIKSRIFRRPTDRRFKAPPNFSRQNPAERSRGSDRSSSPGPFCPVRISGIGQPGGHRHPACRSLRQQRSRSQVRRNFKGSSALRQAQDIFRIILKLFPLSLSIITTL